MLYIVDILYHYVCIPSLYQFVRYTFIRVLCWKRWHFVVVDDGGSGIVYFSCKLWIIQDSEGRKIAHFVMDLIKSVWHFIPFFFPQITNQTIIDDHVYYTSKFYPSGEGSRFWFDVNKLNDAAVIRDHGISERFRVFNVGALSQKKII